ncbi:sensor domain-containing diguanylate cyclase [Anaerobacillus isosaccharinicus]|uniref:Sensor domain-containing diguanylate cyclase n=1 Tax=Anaerobacillus isosaccharinicus TaxID=1532552 RepID=A0AC62A4A5_9BACI|nr:diguanylate cyclase [Anaerobacillus isosaccharinicus]
MINGYKKKANINFSKLFHVTFDLDNQLEEDYSSAIFFLANEEGQLITIREVGGYDPTAAEVIFGLKDKLVTNQLPIIMNHYQIDAIPVTLQKDEEKWIGYFGVVITVEEGSPETVRSLLLGYKQTLIMTTNYLESKQKLENSQKKENIDQMISKLLRETNYTDDFGVFARAFIKKLKEMTTGGDFTLLLLNRNEDLLIPRFSTNQEIIVNKQEYILPFNEIREAIGKLEDNQFRILTKGFSLGMEALNRRYDDYAVIPLEKEGKLFTVLIYGVQEGKVQSQIKNSILDLVTESASLIYKLLNYEYVLKEQKRKELLLQVTKKFHSSMDVSAILSEIIDALKQVFPSFDIHLLLSHEWEVSNDLPVMQLSYGKDKSNEVATNAYLTGKIQIEDIVKERKSVVYAPLRGKQGVYGVLKIMASDSFVFPKHEIDFIEVLADTGGNAIENAELYQQSRQLVEDLQLINKTSHQLNSNLRLSETISYMTKQIKSSFEAKEIGFFMFRTNGDVEVIEGSTNYFLRETILVEINDFCEQIKKEKDALFIGDLASQEPYLLKPFRSFIAVPMVQSGELKGAVFIVHDHAYHFSFNKFKLLQSLIHHSTLAFTNSMLHEELEKLVITDHLTRLYARNFLDEKIEESMDKDAYGCFILIDIDNFKQINDIYGHQVGDDIIIQVANVLKKNIKNTDIAARWGGEELAVYLSKVDQEIGSVVAERIRQRVAEETSPSVTISCGVSDWKQVDEEKSLKALFKQADQALYTAKRSGKNVVIVYDENICCM